jgi:hypothetical protein
VYLHDFQRFQHRLKPRLGCACISAGGPESLNDFPLFRNPRLSLGNVPPGKGVLRAMTIVGHSAGV